MPAGSIAATLPVKVRLGIRRQREGHLLARLDLADVGLADRGADLRRGHVDERDERRCWWCSEVLVLLVETELVGPPLIHWPTTPLSSRPCRWRAPPASPPAGCSGPSGAPAARWPPARWPRRGPTGSAAPASARRSPAASAARPGSARPCSAPTASVAFCWAIVFCSVACDLFSACWAWSTLLCAVCTLRLLLGLIVAQRVLRGQHAAERLVERRLGRLQPLLVLGLGGGQRRLRGLQAVLGGGHLLLGREQALLVLGQVRLLLGLGGLQRVLRRRHLTLGGHQAALVLGLVGDDRGLRRVQRVLRRS